MASENYGDIQYVNSHYSQPSSEFEIDKKIALLEPIVPGVGGYIDSNEKLGEWGTSILQRLTVAEPGRDNLDLNTGHIPAVVAAAAHMRGGKKTETQQLYARAIIMHRMSEVAIKDIAAALNRNALSKTTMSSNNVNMRIGTYIRRGVERYEGLDPKLQHPLGRAGLIARYAQALDEGELEIEWVPLDRVKSELQDKTMPGPGKASERNQLKDADMYTLLMNKIVLGPRDLSSTIDGMLAKTVKNGVLLPEESDLLKSRLFGEDTVRDSEQVRVLLEKVDAIIAPQASTMQERIAQRQEKLRKMRIILATFVKGGQPVSAIEQGIRQDIHNYGARSEFKGFDPKQTLFYLATGLQHTIPS